MLGAVELEVTDHEAVCALYGRLCNMEEISRQTDVPSKILWETKAKSAYKFRHASYRRRVHSCYKSVFQVSQFDPWVEERLEEMREAFDRATLPKSHARYSSLELQEFLKRYGPAVRATDWRSELSPFGMRYLFATMLLTAARAGVSKQIMKACLLGDVDGNAIDAAIQHFETEGRNIGLDHRSQSGLHARILTARASAALWKRAACEQRGAGLADVLSREELQLLIGHHEKMLQLLPSKHARAWSTALQQLNIASAARDRRAVLAAYGRLVAERPEFKDINHPEWSQFGSDSDPDLVFFRVEIYPTLVHQNRS